MTFPKYGNVLHEMLSNIKADAEFHTYHKKVNIQLMYLLKMSQISIYQHNKFPSDQYVLNILFDLKH